VIDAKGSPTILDIELYHAPKLLEPPAIQRDKKGLVTLTSFDSGLDMYYTIDGNDPTTESLKYTAEFELNNKGKVNAIAVDPESGAKSSASSTNFDISKTKWQVIFPDPENDPRGKFIIDSKAGSIWKSTADDLPQAIIVDLGEKLTISGFTYLPSQQRYIDGTVSHYQFYVSKNGKNWGKPVSQGEFSNIRNNPVLQTKMFDPVHGRFIKFVGEREMNDKNFMTIAELGVITGNN